MRTVKLTACLLALLASTAMFAAAALAQSVPLPKAQPKAAAPETAANDPISNLLRPPASVPNGNTPANAAGAAPPPAAGAPSNKGAVTGALQPSSPQTFDNKQRALVERVSTYLSGLQTLVGDFVQVGPDGNRTEGQFYIQKPGRVRFEYNPPAKIDVIADGQSVVVRDRNLATQDVYPLSQTPLRFLLADRIDLLKDTNVVSVSADDIFVTVVVEEQQPLVGTNRLMMMFGAKDFQLRQWTVTDAQGYDTTVAVYNLDQTKKPDPSMFQITYERTMQ
jgi:outer membrane lipoprotein-sorting protein